MKYLPCNRNLKFGFVPTTVTEVKTVVMLLKNSSPGHDGIPIKMLKDNIDTLASLLCHICNASMASGVFPLKLSIAKVIVIFKSGDPKQISNNRPISILPAFSKNRENC